VENINFYRVGGYHPVHLHDSLNDGQYRVIDKLGYGGYSTVWLCRDTTAASPRYVAVKIIKGGQSGKECRELIMSNALKARGIDNDPWGEHICLPLGQFELEGPYGTHLAWYTQS
jgi:serine/threonine-protein kinase SRPK3